MKMIYKKLKKTDMLYNLSNIKLTRCVKAIEQYPYSYQFIHNMTEDLWRLAVKKDGKMLHMIEDINLKLKLTREITDELYNL